MTLSNEPPFCTIGLRLQHNTIGLVASPDVLWRNTELLTKGSLAIWHPHPVALLAILLPLGDTA